MGLISTSNPRSANAVAITFMPRSWPSCPILVTRILGRRPSFSLKSSVLLRIDAMIALSSYSAAYTPDMHCVVATKRPNTFSRASEISPTVARALIAGIHASSKLAPDSAAWVTAVSACLTALASRLAFSDLSLVICSSRTLAGTSRISKLTSSSIWYLLTPTITSLPWSIRACRRAAASSILILGMPVSMALAIPPNSSTSSIILPAWRIMPSVKDST